MKYLKFNYTIFTFLSLLFLSACQQQPANHVLHDLNGNTINFANLQGKWVLINYWASWCKPCYTEIPALNAFYQKYKTKVIVLGVSYDMAKGSELRTIVAKMQINFPTLANDPKQMLGIKNIPGLPATYVFNPKGHLTETLFGLQTEQSLAKAIGLS